MWDLITQVLSEQELLRNGIATAILFLVALALRSAALRFVRRADWASDSIQLRWTIQVRWVSILLVILGLAIVWASELRTFALSVVAIAVALVLATKELILCVSGSVLRAMSRAFTVGDRIEVGRVRGDVVDMRALTTTILETGPWHRRTGRAVVIPNSILLIEPVINETFTDDLVLHTITIPLKSSVNWQNAERRLLDIANNVCAPFLEDAQRHRRGAVTRSGVRDFLMEPKVNIHVPEADKFNLVLRVPSRAQEKGHTEQQILRRFFAPDAGESIDGYA